MLMTSTVEQSTDGKAVVTVNGALTLGTSLKILDSQIQHLVDGDVRDLLLDLSAVDYADSAGLGFLIHTYGLVDSKQGKLRLKGVQPRVAELIRMTKLDTFLSLAESGQAAAS